MNNNSSLIINMHIQDLLATIEVGTWDWELATNKVIYSSAWGRILGYEISELPQTVATWEKMVLPNDLEHANAQIERHLCGEKSFYEAEFRMVCKDNTIIWAQDKGQITEYDENGKPIRFMGVLQNVTRLKEAELRLLENQETLDLAVSVAELGTWDWNLVDNNIRYNDEYLKILGYKQSDMTGSMEEWESMNHPEDLPISSKLLDAYLSGHLPAYECEIRMLHRNGYYIWTRDVGKIVDRDHNGKPTRLIGGHLNIDGLKRSEKSLTQALQTLEHNKIFLESEIETRTKELVEQDKMLWTVNQVSRKLLTFEANDNFSKLVQNCLQLLGESINKNRIYIWKDRTNACGNVCCTQIYEWVRDAVPIQGNAEFEEISYENLPAFRKAIDGDICLNNLIRNLSESERAILEPQGIKTILIAPIAINGKSWGFIGVDNCENEQLFNATQETMLLMSGSMLASTIDKMETEANLREVEQRTQIMLNATPLCCNLWTPEFKNMSCNDEAVRLFGLSSQDEYLEKFNELSPLYQPSGRLSSELAAENIALAFKNGYCKFDWLHQKIDGTPVPSEIILVRIKYKGGFIVAGYTRDLREFNAMLTALQSKEDDLRAARDEALLSSKAKSNFLANMSHEIRTPMNAISGLAEIILRDSSDEKIAEYSKGIKTACGNLLNIINDILDISKIESGKLEIYSSEYELASLLNDVITISRMRLGSKPIMFITDIDSKLPAQLIGDEIRIKQILINVLSNAIKFTHEGCILLKVWSEIQNKKATLYFSIKDSGVGIKDEDLMRLFAEFERVNTTKNRKIEGTGLGLAITKQLCEMMHGRVEVNSVFGEGSEFIIVVPQECPSYNCLSLVTNKKNVLLYEPRELYRSSITKTILSLDCNCVPCSNQSELYDSILSTTYDYILTPAMHLKKMQALVYKNNLTTTIAVFANYDEHIDDSSVYTMLFPISCLQLANLLNGHLNDETYSHHGSPNSSFTAPTARVLVVDDNPVNLRVAQGLMTPYLFEIDTAENGLIALEMVQKNKYDLVFMDHMMPEMDGIDATVAIRQLSGNYYKNLPIVALTANALVGTREMFIREGMDDFLSKPIEINKLGNMLLKWLPQEKIINSLAKVSMPAPSNSTLIIEGVNTEHGILSVGGSLDNYMQILVAYYDDGNQKCSSLIKNINAKNITTFCTEIHSIKSTSATIGALKVSTLAANLEAAAQINNIEYINVHLGEFLTEFKAVLEAIRPMLVEDFTSMKAQESKPCGDVVLLTAALPKLYDAAEFANISRLEEHLDDLDQFGWDQAITNQLTAIRECVSVFDYDGILACVTKLQELPLIEY